MSENQAQWFIPVIPALTQEAKADSHEVKDSLGYIPRLIPYELVLQDWRERERALHLRGHFAQQGTPLAMSGVRVT